MTIAPHRLLDSRVSGDKPAAATVHTVHVDGVPADATAAVINITVTNPDGPGFVTVFHCGTPIPTASNLNYITG